MKRLLISLLSLAALTAYATPITIVNPSFEAPTSQGNFNTVSAGGLQSIMGWTVTAGSVDHIANYWQASDGIRSIDMSGTGAGKLQQSIFIPTSGLLSIMFDMAGNPDSTGNPDIKTLQVSLFSGAGPAQSFTFDAANATRSNMGWVTQTASFNVLSAGTYTLEFASLTPSAYGPALDNVSAKVPDSGATLMMLGIGLAAIGAVRRKFRA